ncbi:hemolysin family protein [Zooshikella harenae]|uniref:HlyC/CorC family transporter n=1 Tax=Zooshikella harenae TaxID=2827238 RepID=A0ABS5ZFR9_9GAMM|nr:hemolysin family protein [Zooshikella harenae]MBU2712912.1 HlyC/CorC family transporter [Zooshikella harenae]
MSLRSTLKKLRSIAFVLLLLISVSFSLADVTVNETLSNSGGLNKDIIWLIFYVLMALGFSFVCSVAEAVLLSVTPSYIEGLKDKRPKLAALLKRLKQEKVDQALAAILTLNTIAHTVGAIGAGAKATVVFGSAWFGFFSAAMTLMILFLSEIIPKTIGAVYWSKLTATTALVVQVLIVGLYPIVWVSEKLTRLIARGNSLHEFSRDELIAMARVGEYTGHIQKKESRIIRNLLRFDSLTITDIMTPRTVISAIPEDMLISDALRFVSQTPFSRLPVFKRDIDDITGFVLKNDVLILNTQGRTDEKLKSLKREILAVPELITLSDLLGQFLMERQHIAIVVDEFGCTEGVVTFEDIIETLIGMEIIDETDNVEDMRVFARKQWVERAKKLGIEGNIAERSKAENNK